MTVEERLNQLMSIEEDRGYLYGSEQHEWQQLRFHEDEGRGDWVYDINAGVIVNPEPRYNDDPIPLPMDEFAYIEDEDGDFTKHCEIVHAPLILLRNGEVHCYFCWENIFTFGDGEERLVQDSDGTERMVIFHAHA